MKEKIMNPRNQKRMMLVTLLISIVLICALSLGWFYNNRHISTFAHVEKPSALSIKGYNETTVEQISLSSVDLSDTSHKASFVFCVTGKNQSKYKLELAYTTNVPFQYAIRETTQSETPVASGLTYQDDAGKSYYYPDTGNLLNDGTFVNKNSETDVVANKSKHAEAYNTYENVQKHAEPVYYLFKDVPVRDDKNSTFVDYYILELTWTADQATTFQKETDLVYLLAANATASDITTTP